MKQEDKELLLKDLAARLPYGVKIMFSHNGFRWDWEQTLDDIQKCDDGEYAVNGWGIHGIKPYLRPMSSMTKKEKHELLRFGTVNLDRNSNAIDVCCVGFWNHAKVQDYLNSIHIDYRGLIERGLAIAVTEENNPYKD